MTKPTMDDLQAQEERVAKAVRKTIDTQKMALEARDALRNAVFSEDFPSAFEVANAFASYANALAHYQEAEQEQEWEQDVCSELAALVA